VVQIHSSRPFHSFQGLRPTPDFLSTSGLNDFAGGHDGLRPKETGRSRDLANRAKLRVPRKKSLPGTTASCRLRSIELSNPLLEPQFALRCAFRYEVYTRRELFERAKWEFC
jgi:hypothetical protein